MGVEWSGETKRSGDEAPPRARFIWCLYREAKRSGRAHAVGRGVVVAKCSLGAQWNGKRVLLTLKPLTGRAPWVTDFGKVRIILLIRSFLFIPQIQ